jgi:catechol 2,3-dioxygenase-like lactoylglutathione lyase family enzyme
MLGSNDAVATIAVKDTQAAKNFYERTLGFQPADGEGDGVLVYKSGRSKLFVYKSDYAGTNKATSATWVVPDVDTAVRDLKGKGVRFEHYDMPEMKRQGDVHVAGDMKAAWFKDPDGNILGIVSEGHA